MGKGCRQWYDAQARSCPACGSPRHAFNPWLRHAQLNNALYAQAARAEAEK